MVFFPGLFMDDGLSAPPPQAVISQRPLWLLLIFLLGCAFLVRIVIAEVFGIMLTGIMMVLAVTIIRDGMKEVSRYGFLFGVFSAANLAIWLLPTVMAIFWGRSSRNVQTGPIGQSDSENLRWMNYTVTMRTSPFFDKHAGLRYNLESVGLLLMPINSLLGAYLGLSAHAALGRPYPSLLGEEETLDGEEAPEAPHAFSASGAAAGNRRAATYGAAVAHLAPPADGSGGRASRTCFFSGASHKLAG